MLFQKNQNTFQSNNPNSGADKKKTLIALSVICVFLLIITAIFSTGKENATQSPGLELEKYEGSAYNVSKPLGFEANGNSSLTTFKDSSSEDAIEESFTIERYSASASLISPERLKEVVTQKGDGTQYEGLESELISINNKATIKLTISIASEGLPIGRTYYIFGNVNIWKITFSGGLNSILTKESDKIVATFALKRGDADLDNETTNEINTDEAGGGL